MWKTVIPVLVLLYLLRVIRSTFKSKEVLTLFKELRPRHFLISWGTLLLLLAMASMLLWPNTLLRWGWWSALGGTGNVVFGQSNATGTSVYGILLVLVIALLFVFVLGSAAYTEEIVFRLGDERRCLAQRIRRSVVFGLEHLVMGIPIGVALAISVAGFIFSTVYLHRWKETRSQHASVLESTRVHIALNSTVLLLVMIVLGHELMGYWH